MMAEGADLHVLCVVEDNAGNTQSFEFLDDGLEACLEAAYENIKTLSQQQQAVRYALVYTSSVELEPLSNNFSPAILLEFGEKGYLAYSAHCLYEHAGDPQNFVWSDPMPAGEVEPLIV